jgi:hypothetical protein
MLTPLTEAEILNDIDHYESQLAKVPPGSVNSDDLIARQIFETLLEQRQQALRRLRNTNI